MTFIVGAEVKVLADESDLQVVRSNAFTKRKVKSSKSKSNKLQSTTTTSTFLLVWLYAHNVKEKRGVCHLLPMLMENILL